MQLVVHRTRGVCRFGFHKTRAICAKGRCPSLFPAPRVFHISFYCTTALLSWSVDQDKAITAGVGAKSAWADPFMCLPFLHWFISIPNQHHSPPPPKHPDCPLKFDASEAPWLNGLGSLHSGRLPNLSITVLETKQDVMNNIWPFCFLRFAFGWMSIIELSGLKDFIYRHHRCMAKNVIFRIVYSTA